jgi:uncharacterized membrane protein
MSTFHVFAGEQGKVADDVQLRKIGIADVLDAIRRGYEDFAEKPSHYVFLVVIYPISGLILMTWAAGDDAFQLIYPLLTGFALIGPIAAIGLYEISRRREAGLDTSWKHALEVVRSPAVPSILAVGGMLVVLFVIWMLVAQGLYAWLYGAGGPDSLGAFLLDVVSTRRGWTLIILGNGIGFLFALVALSTTVVAFPLMLDRDVGAVAAVRASVQAMMLNPIPMLFWGLVVVGGLVAGSVPVLAGLIIVLPVLGHSTWHIYRKVVVGSDPRRRVQSAPA